MEEGEYWYAHEGPPEWQALSREWDAAVDAILAEAFLGHGELELAADPQADPLLEEGDFFSSLRILTRRLLLTSCELWTLLWFMQEGHKLRQPLARRSSPFTNLDRDNWRPQVIPVRVGARLRPRVERSSAAPLLRLANVHPPSP